MQTLEKLLLEVKNCHICEAHLPLGPRPVLQCHENARILIAGQAPGRKVHESGIPFQDASGDRLREWMGISKDEFYNAEKVAILPMGFCYPGSTKSGDNPPRKECALTWRKPLQEQLPDLQLTIILGLYAQRYHLDSNLPLTQTVQNWREYWPHSIPLPHPSPRNNIWLKRNPWFEEDVLPPLKEQIQSILNT